jgi:hypothetical protein
MQFNLGKFGLDKPFSALRADYRQKIIPYREIPGIANVVLNPKDKVSKFSNLDSTFSPSDIGHQEVANQGQDRLKNSIIFDALKNSISPNKKVDPKTLIRTYDTLNSKGFSPYITDSSFNMLEKLRNRLIQEYPTEFGQDYRKIPDSAKSIGKDLVQGGGALLGNLIGSHFGHPYIGTLGGYKLGNLANKSNIPKRALDLTLKSSLLPNILSLAKISPFALNSGMQ